MRGKPKRFDEINRRTDKLLKKAFQMGREEGMQKQLRLQRIDYNTLSPRLKAKQDEINIYLENEKRSNRANRKREHEERISFLFYATKKLRAIHKYEKGVFCVQLNSSKCVTN